MWRDAVAAEGRELEMKWQSTVPATFSIEPGYLSLIKYHAYPGETWHRAVYTAEVVGLQLDPRMQQFVTVPVSALAPLLEW
jgi:hypothetical protein